MTIIQPVYGNVTDPQKSDEVPLSKVKGQIWRIHQNFYAIRTFYKVFKKITFGEAGDSQAALPSKQAHQVTRRKEWQ